MITPNAIPITIPTTKASICFPLIYCFACERCRSVIEQPACHLGGLSPLGLCGCLVSVDRTRNEREVRGDDARAHLRRAARARRAGVVNSAPAVVARAVAKRFGAVEALAGLDIEVRTGEIYGLLGPNGSGKTTFIRCLAGLLRPDAGDVTVLGRTPREAVSAGRVGYMTQAPALYGDLSVEENLDFFARLEGVADADDRIDEVLAMVELADRKRSTVNTLSGGMR